MRPGGIVEWLVAGEGAGAVTLALQMIAQSIRRPGVWAVVDLAREFYCRLGPVGEFHPSKILVIRPATLQETCWSIEQCLRCPGVSATWAWVDQRFPARVHRRWQMAAETGGGVGMFFRPGPGATGTDLGRLTFAGHAAAGRPGGYQAVAYRSTVSPGRPGRLPPGVGDRPCRGSCASGSRGGPSSDCEARGPSLAGRNWCCLPAKASGPSIIACSAKAERLGLRIGQPLAEAKALLPKAVFLPADVAADRAALVQLAIEFQCFTPLVGLEETAEPECLLCEVAGCTHLWDGEEGFLDAVRSYWRVRGYHIQLALAGTVGAAWALAHTTVLSLVPAGR